MKFSYHALKYLENVYQDHLSNKIADINKKIIVIAFVTTDYKMRDNTVGMSDTKSA